MSLALAQTNLNHSAGAQSMLMQCLAEWGGGLAIAADPYRIPESHPNWAGDSLVRVAVSQHARDTPPMIPISGRASRL